MASTAAILSDPTCAGYQVMSLLTNKWTIPVLVELTSGVKRYTHIHSALAGVSHKVLSQTLTALEQHRLVALHVYEVVPPHVEYTLTPLAESLYGQLLAIATWAEAHAVDLGCRPMEPITLAQ